MLNSLCLNRPKAGLLGRIVHVLDRSELFEGVGRMLWKKTQTKAHYFLKLNH